jgi:hypothetical protein
VNTLDAQQVIDFNQNGWLITDSLQPSEAASLQSWVDEVAAWPKEGGDWLHHEELTIFGPSLCRTEYFTPFHEGLRKLLADGSMLDTASALLGEQAVLYKEKINYKLAGGAGWEPHQDAPAYPFIKTHVSCMMAVDNATTENGCLEVVSRAHQKILPMDINGCIQPDIAAAFNWQPVELCAGQTLWFHSRTPHRSGDNRSIHDRRALYPTYNALSEGDLREEYYATKRSEFAKMGAGGSEVRLSLINDFRGKPVK